MKIIVTHASPDWDAITSVWLLKRFLQGWENAEVRFVPAGQRISNFKFPISNGEDPIEKMNGDEGIHVDTGLGPLDHHQTDDQNVSAASRTFDFVKRVESSHKEKHTDKMEAIERIVRVVVDIDHFKEVFWENPTADYHEFSLLGVLDGLKLQKQNDDMYYVEFGMQILDALLHNFENRIWAEREIKENGIVFTTQFGKGIGFSTINDDVIKLAQKMGYRIVVRKDPRKGYVRIKARPSEELKVESARPIASSPRLQTPNIGGQVAGEGGRGKLKNKETKKNAQLENIDLTLAYEKLKKIDPDATWFLHVSRKMLLNGTVKNPTMVPTKLSLEEIIKVLESV